MDLQRFELVVGHAVFSFGVIHRVVEVVDDSRPTA